MSNWPWDELGIEETRDTSAIRKAYSAKLKKLDLDKQIEEYSRLRQARGFALHLAQNPPVEDHDEDDVLANDFDVGLADDLGDEAEEQPPRHYESEAAAEQPMQPEYEPDPEKEKLDIAWRDISALVLPGGEQSDDAFTLEEWDSAQHVFATLVELASGGNLDLYDSIDFHLSELLAMGWPRSAPLVEAANEEFNWFAEVGKITERPALVFLNARIAGMRFQEQVETPGHRFHKAWNDLLGSKTPIWIKRWSLNRDRVLELLATIRTHFPELESLLDQDRINDWEYATNSGCARIIQYIAIGWIGLALLGQCARNLEPDDEASYGYDQRDVEAVDVVYEQVVRELLGDDWDAARLEQTSGPFARSIRYEAATKLGLDGEPDLDAALDGARNVTRNIILAAREDFSFEEKVQAQQLFLTWLRNARAQGVTTCKSMLNGIDFTPPLNRDVDMSETYAKEAELLNLVLERNPSLSDLPSGATSANIPGWMIGRIIDRSGLSENEVRQALRQDNNNNTCDVMIAMMEEVAAAPGRAPAQLLTFP